jgi:hypothetical protein
MCVCLCVCVCVYLRVCPYVCIYTHTHVFDCVEILYELLLLLNNTASETFLHKSGELTGYLSLGGRPGGDWTNT